MATVGPAIASTCRRRIGLISAGTVTDERPVILDAINSELAAAEPQSYVVVLTMSRPTSAPSMLWNSNWAW